MSYFKKWKAVAAMIFVEFALAVVNALFKKVLSRGMNQLVITTYRFSIAAIALTPVACFLERYGLFTHHVLMPNQVKQYDLIIQLAFLQEFYIEFDRSCCVFSVFQRAFGVSFLFIWYAKVSSSCLVKIYWCALTQ